MPTDFEMLLIKMDDGFGKVYTKIDALRDDFHEHMPICNDRFGKIETWITVKDAINGEKKIQVAETKDWGKWFVRLCLGAIALWAIAESLSKFMR